MELKNTGSEIKRFHVKEKSVVFYLDNVKYEVPLNTSLEFNLYEGKILDNKTLKKINKDANRDKYFNYCLSLLIKRSKTVFEIKNKLELKGCNKQDSEIIIKRLIKQDLLNDERYAKEYQEYLLERGYGQIRIINDLLKKGVDRAVIDKLRFSSNDEVKNAIERLKTLEKAYRNDNYKTKQEKIYKSLIRHGYKSYVALEAMKHISKKDDKHESECLNKDLLKAKKRFNSLPDGNEKVIRYLMSKGYSLNDIKTKLGGY